MNYKRCVITGGIGSGKTTLLDELKKRPNLWCADEQALALVTAELKAAGDRLPWTQPEEVSRMVIPKRIALYEAAPINRMHCIFDRGVPDSVGFLQIAGKPVSQELRNACSTYRYDLIFWAPPWKEIYVNRAERAQPWSHAEPLGYELRKVYSDLGYKVMELPKATVAERLAFVINRLESPV